MRAGDGSTAASSAAAAGVGTNRAPTRSMGASSRPNSSAAEDRRDLGTRARELDGVVRDDGPARASDRFDDGLDVERNERAQVDDLGADTVLGGERRPRPATRRARCARSR